MRLDDESTWPVEVIQFLDQNLELFDDWEGPTSESRIRDRKPECSRFSAKEYDQAIGELEQLLRSYILECGYHCTRLTDAEAQLIRRHGMQLQNASTLRARIQALLKASLIDEEIAQGFANANSADDSNRARMIWFCFFPPHLAGENGIEGFFRFWGGEALYRWHDKDMSRRASLQRIGTPMIVIADIPIADLNQHSYLSSKLIKRYFRNRGGDIREDVDHEGYTQHPVPATSIRRIVRFPDPEFIALTQCDSWSQPLA